MTEGWGRRPVHRVPARKILPPPPPTPHVRRERLGARVHSEAVANRPVTLVSAPTGYGKSTFLSSWASSTSTRVAWLTLDDLDNTVATLWHGILSSIEGAAVQPAGRPPAPLAGRGWTPETDTGSSIVDAVITVVEDDPDPLVLVLDNIDELRSAEARSSLDRLLRYLPPQLRVILAGRYDPPLALHRLRASGQLTEFRARDLQFTRGDIQALADLSGVPLTDDEQHELLLATSGWPVAVRMALVTARDAPVAPTVRRLLSPRSPVADLLVSDLLSSLEPDLARFVLRATTCHRIDAVLADTLDGSTAGSRRLAECVERGLFLEREPGQHDTTTYRWHDFFRSQCQARLATTEPSTWRSLHRTAAHHWRDRDLEEAVEHALAGGRPALASQCISDRWIELVLRGQHALLLSLCLKIPPPLDETPDLLLLVAVCRYLEGSPAQADLQLRRARAHAEAAPPTGDGGRFALLEPLLRIVLADEPPDLAEIARHGVALMSQAPPTSDDAAVAGAEFVVGQILTRAEQTAAGAALLQASATIATSRQMHALRLACEAELALVASTEVGPGVGRTLARRVAEEADALGWGTAPTLTPALLALACSAYEHDDLDEARSLTDRATSRTQPGDDALRARTQTMLLEIALAAGDPAGAEALHEGLTHHRSGRYLPLTWPVVVAVLDARWSYARGAADDARHAAEEASANAMLPHHPTSLVWCADLLRLDGAGPLARAVLDGLPATCRATHVLAAHRVVGALLADGAGDDELAHRLLEQALAIAEVDDIRRPFVDRACQVLPLLRTHLDWGSLHATYCVTMLDHLSGARPAAPLVPSFWSLTPREHEVLLLMRSAMPASEIASAAFVSVNTVKTHQRAIYRKLGVVGRREAIRVATERGLL